MSIVTLSTCIDHSVLFTHTFFLNTCTCISNFSNRGTPMFFFILLYNMYHIPKLWETNLLLTHYTKDKLSEKYITCKCFTNTHVPRCSRDKVDRNHIPKA